MFNADFVSVYSNSSEKYIRATGTGNSFDEAKQKAFQQAIEIKVGSFIDSER